MVSLGRARCYLFLFLVGTLGIFALSIFSLSTLHWAKVDAGSSRTSIGLVELETCIGSVCSRKSISEATTPLNRFEEPGKETLIWNIFSVLTSTAGIVCYALYWIKGWKGLWKMLAFLLYIGGHVLGIIGIARYTTAAPSTVGPYSVEWDYSYIVWWLVVLLGCLFGVASCFIRTSGEVDKESTSASNQEHYADLNSSGYKPPLAAQAAV